MLWLICYVIKLSVSFVFCLYEYKYNEIKKGITRKRDLPVEKKNLHGANIEFALFYYTADTLVY